jgi:thiamine biosynthesis protein ThiI
MDSGYDVVTLHVTLSGDVFLKSRRTQKKLISRVRNNIGDALAAVAPRAAIDRIGTHRYRVVTPADSAPDVVGHLRRVFGVSSIDRVEEVPFSTLEDLAASVASHQAHRVAGATFAVRVRRRGNHDWRSPDLAIAAGRLLVEAGGAVDLVSPEVTVNGIVLDDHAYVVSDHVRGAGGLPLGTQERSLCLLSGGFDSVVAAWMVMSRGSPVDFVHFSLNCAQSDHALAVARGLWDGWGHGSQPIVHLVEFQPVKDALFADVDPHMRQITLKVMMAQAASSIAEESGTIALVTGDSLGQVSSQTLPHLAAVSSAARIPILRPLVGMPKEDIIDRARAIGTAEISARAREVCDLSEGQPVATAARRAQIDRSADRVPEEVLADAVATRKTFKLSDWSPGQM